MGKRFFFKEFFWVNRKFIINKINVMYIKKLNERYEVLRRIYGIFVNIFLVIIFNIYIRKENRDNWIL